MGLPFLCSLSVCLDAGLRAGFIYSFPSNRPSMRLGPACLLFSGAVPWLIGKGGWHQIKCPIHPLHLHRPPFVLVAADEQGYTLLFFSQSTPIDWWMERTDVEWHRRKGSRVSSWYNNRELKNKESADSGGRPCRRIDSSWPACQWRGERIQFMQPKWTWVEPGFLFGWLIAWQPIVMLTQESYSLPRSIIL